MITIHHIGMSFRYTLNRLLESLMIIIGIAFSVAIVSCVVSIYQSYYRNINANLNKNPNFRVIMLISKANLQRNSIAVTKTGNENVPAIQFNIEDMAEAKKECPAVEFAFSMEPEEFTLGEDPWGRRPETDNVQQSAADAVPPNSTIHTFKSYAVFNDFFRFHELKASHGSLFIDKDIENRNQVLILGSNLKEKLYPKMADKDVIGKNIRINSRSFKIIGVLEHKENEDDNDLWSMNNIGYYPFSSNFSYQYRKYLFNISFGVSDAEFVSKAQEQLQNFFNMKYGEDYFFLLTRTASIQDQKKQIMPTVLVVIFLASAVLLISSINMLNLMLARIFKRQKNIGINIAIGATKRNIFSQTLVEVSLLSLIGCLLGVIFSFLAMIIFKKAVYGTSIVMNLKIAHILTAIVGIWALNLAFGIVPAMNAMRTKPAEILKKE